MKDPLVSRLTTKLIVMSCILGGVLTLLAAGSFYLFLHDVNTGVTHFAIGIKGTYRVITADRDDEPILFGVVSMLNMALTIFLLRSAADVLSHPFKFIIEKCRTRRSR